MQIVVKAGIHEDHAQNNFEIEAVKILAPLNRNASEQPEAPPTWLIGIELSEVLKAGLSQ